MEKQTTPHLKRVRHKWKEREMKKLMIALAGVALAATSQAVACKWSVSEMCTGDNFDAAVNLTGMNAYLYTVDSWDANFDGTASILSSDYYSGTKAVTTAKYDASKKQAQWTVAEQLASGIDADDIANGFYIVISDGDQFYRTEALTGVTTWGDADTPPATYNPAKIAITKNDSPISSMTKFSGGDVPEPTSGLLIMLGMAGLALRRRRA